VVGTKLSQRFENCGIGQTLRTGAHSLTVVGLMEGGNSAFDSEIWIDADEGRSMFDREYYSSVLARMRSPQAAEAFMARMEQDRRLPLRVVHELTYYGEQTRTAKPIKLVGDFLAIAMSIGAVFAGMNTMYASVGARTREIGTLRVLGYRRRTILLGFIIEGGILSAIGGVLGCLLSLFLHGRTTATLSFETFSETIFQFRITPELALEGMIFAVLLGVVGSLLPAIRASRLPVIAALKSV
jgi:putative ABC transport system permease protein